MARAPGLECHQLVSSNPRSGRAIKWILESSRGSADRCNNSRHFRVEKRSHKTAMCHCVCSRSRSESNAPTRLLATGSSDKRDRLLSGMPLASSSRRVNCSIDGRMPMRSNRPEWPRRMKTTFVPSLCSFSATSKRDSPLIISTAWAAERGSSTTSSSARLCRILPCKQAATPTKTAKNASRRFLRDRGRAGASFTVELSGIGIESRGLSPRTSQFVDLRVHIRYVLSSHPAGDQSGAAFEKSATSNVMIEEPEPVFARNAAGDLLQEAPAFLNISEQARSN